MTSNFDFTEKTEQSIAEAIQFAKDYANAQGS
jgi:ATP-dependent Clp protease ATP-binding subunit ClpB